jgi:flagellin
MSLRINTNVDALTAYNSLQNTQSSLSTSLARLSSGLRINHAADDAAGLAISQGMTAEINGLGQAIRNAQDGINFVQTADGALQESQAILQRMRTLAVQAANDTNSSASRSDIQTEIDQLNDELDRIASASNFNGVQFLLASGGSSLPSGTSALNFQVGADSYYSASGSNELSLGSAGNFNVIQVTLTANWDSAALKTSGVSVTSFSKATSALNTIDWAIQQVSTERATLGALQNRFQHTINNLTVAQANLQASNSTIMDTDMAAEMVNYTRANILSQAGTAMLRQANAAPNSVLALLQ